MVATVVLSIMAAMATIGLTFAWMTTEERRKRDQQGSHELQSITVAPGSLSALNYVPSDVNVVAGLHVAELMANPETRSLLAPERADGQPVELEELTGLKLDNLEHVVLGLRVEQLLLPRVTLVVQTRAPYDAVEVREALHARRALAQGKRTLYRFPLRDGQLQLSATLWFAGEQTLVAALEPKDFEVVPAAPAGGIERFATAIQKLFKETLTEGTPAWAVGHAGRWDTVLKPQPIPGVPDVTLVDIPKEVLKLAAKVRTLGIWVQPGALLDWHGVIECGDAKGTLQLKEYLAEHGVGSGRPLNANGQEGPILPLASDLWKSLTVKQEDSWLWFHARSGVDSLRDALVRP
jgi:hypothetical protein